MSSSPSEPTAQDSLSLEQLILDSGHRPGERIADFARLASDVQRQRRSMGVSDADGITRSVALWVLMELDDTIKAALVGAGVDHAALAGSLSLGGVA